MENDCFGDIAGLLKKNEIDKAFDLLNRHILGNEELRDAFESCLANHAYHLRTEKHFNLGAISWETYNMANAQIIKRAIDLARSVCAFLGQKQKQIQELAGVERELGNKFRDQERLKREHYLLDQFEDLMRQRRELEQREQALLEEFRWLLLEEREQMENRFSKLDSVYANMAQAMRQTPPAAQGESIAILNWFTQNLDDLLMEIEAQDSDRGHHPG